MTHRETETNAPAPSKWRRLKESLLRRKLTATAEELTLINEPEAAPLPEPIHEPEPPKDTPPAARSSSLLPDSPAPIEKGNREKKGRRQSERRQMERTLAARLTPTEYADITEKAARAGLSLSAYARACLLGNPGLRAKRAPPVNRAALAQAMAALNRVGNNVNQIAHNLNAGGHPASKEIAEAKTELSDCLKAILKSLGRATE